MPLSAWLPSDDYLEELSSFSGPKSCSTKRCHREQVFVGANETIDDLFLLQIGVVVLRQGAGVEEVAGH